MKHARVAIALALLPLLYGLHAPVLASQVQGTGISSVITKTQPPAHPKKAATPTRRASGAQSSKTGSGSTP